MSAPAKAPEAAAAARPAGPHPGSEPRANPSARWITIVIGAILVALSAVLARELWFLTQNEPYDSWLEPVYEFFGTTPIDGLAVTVGIVVALVGLWLLITAFLPRRHTHMRVNSPVSIWVRPVDVARKATNTARAEVGGPNIRSKADRKKLTVQVEDDGSGTAQERVAAALNTEFSRMARPPAVTVKMQPRQAAPATGTATTQAPQEVQR